MHWQLGSEHCKSLWFSFFAETWFAILFTVIVEIVPANTRGVCTAFFLFVMNVIAGEITIK